MIPHANFAVVKWMLTSAFVLSLALAASTARAQTFSVIYTFSFSDGANPVDGLVIDADGNLYGTTSNGGSLDAGTIFKVNLSGQETVLYYFNGGSDGANPRSKLVMDAAGNLYGTTYNGGGSSNCSGGCGTVFKIDTDNNESVLYRFGGGTDGANPVAGLTMDDLGNLYGTTFNGGAYGYGTIFRLNTSNKEAVLYSFTGGSDGANPVAGVIFGINGALYGSASLGGDLTCTNDGMSGCGTVFQLMPISLTAKGPAALWRLSVLHTFEMQNDGGTPYAPLITDGSRNLYGAATSGGTGDGGTVFELTPSGSSWNFNVLYGLSGWTVSGTFGGLVKDTSGNIFATTHCDGTYQSGTIYELTPSGNAWNYTSLYVFTGNSDGQYSFSQLVVDDQGNLYGTTQYGGSGDGVVFKLTP